MAAHPDVLAQWPVLADLDPFLVWCVPAHIAAVRMAAGLSRQQLADRLHVRLQDVARWEIGRIRPRWAERDALATLAREVMQASE